MYSKLRSFLFICLLGFQINCQTQQASVNILDYDDKQIAETNISDEKIRLLFIESGLGEGDGKLEELMTFPKERIVAVVQKIKDNGVAEGEEGYQNEYQSEHLKIKSAYFLWKLGADTAANEKYIVDLTKTKDFRRHYALSYLESIISEGKKEYLPVIFEFAPEADAAYFTEVSGLFQYELENSPKTFLLYLSKMPFKIRKGVYEVVSFKGEVYDAETFQKIKANVGKLTEDKEVKNIAGEFLREVKN
jgi:hypothetical protein